ncbi:MAG: hypothetical protein M1822_006583 [Bathelium mastoideum]|nr:MAG: hypothetical protein M1822_006583 [Bathelium mastoideum]
MDKNQAQNARMPKGGSIQTSSTVPRKRTAMEAAEEAYVADEDRFVLRQAKRKAEIRVRENRARPIDWLAINLRFVDPSRNPLDEDIADDGLDVVDPEVVFEGLSDSQARELSDDIETFLTLETDRSNWEYWQTMKLVLNDRRERLGTVASKNRTLNPVAKEMDRILQPKSFDELQTLEKQVRQRLEAPDVGDIDYWKQLLQSLLIWKAKAHFKTVTKSLVQSRLKSLGMENYREAIRTQEELQNILPRATRGAEGQHISSSGRPPLDQSLDPEPLLKVRPDDKNLEHVDESTFLESLQAGRRKLENLEYQSLRLRSSKKPNVANAGSVVSSPRDTGARKADFGRESPMSALQPYITKKPDNGARLPTLSDSAQYTDMLYQRELERGLAENEEIFATEEDISTSARPEWASKYRPRKPKSLNRVQMGYEWNKYNQTHYDNENPPPKVVQGYKFNIFYPDLVEKSKAPTYRMEREGGRKKGEYWAAGGADDYCTIRFKAGAPYEDLAFRIVDRQWDYSARKDHGFRSAFENVST